MPDTTSELELSINAPDGVLIPGVMCGQAADVDNVVLLLHGITTQKNEYGDFFGRLARSLAAVGIASLRIDFRGHGDSDVSSREFTITSQILDTIAAMAWLRHSVPDCHLHLLGCSFGSPPAIFAAKLRPDEVRSVSMICPVLDYEGTFLDPSTEWAQELFNTRTLDAAFTDGWLRMNPDFTIDVKLLIEMSLLRPYDALSGLQQPCLLIHGDADSMVPHTLSMRHASHLPHVELVAVPRMDHGYADVDDEAGTNEQSERNFDRILNLVSAHVGGSRDS